MNMATPSSSPKTRRWLVIAALSALCGGLAILFVALNSRDGQSPFITIQTSETFGAETAREWVSFADAVVHVRIVAEERFDLRDPEAIDADEGMINRRVTADVAEVLWIRAGGSTPPAKMTFGTLGWVRSNGRELRMRKEGGGTLDVGKEYVFPAVYLAEENTWAPLTSDSVLPVIGRRIGSPAALAPGLVPPIRSQLVDRDVDSVNAIMKDTEPYPGLEGLDPLERAVKVYGGNLKSLRQARGLPAAKP